MERRVLQEELLDAWLGLSAVISNNRLVPEFSFNEAFVLNLLYKQYEKGGGRKLTATDLCRRTNVLKSQMNAILTSLEKRQLIIRTRSEEDRRQIDVEINPEKLEQYFACHEQVLELVDGLLERLGPEEGARAAVMLKELADSFQDVIGGGSRQMENGAEDKGCVKKIELEEEAR